VPCEFEYSIIGHGRLATHLCRYFSLSNIAFSQWHIDLDKSLLLDILKNSNIVLLAISDNSIESFIDENHKILENKTVIHFSGALVSDKAYGCHPLMTFTEQLYELDVYRSILFCTDEEMPDFKDLFPKLDNPSIKVPAESKPYYHSLCVMANNFTCILWQKFYNEMINSFGAKPEQLDNFLKRTTDNISNNYKSCLTGPLVRNDKITIEKNLKSLEQDSFHSVYLSFIQAYKESMKSLNS